jgi:hypothetical protein
VPNHTSVTLTLHVAGDNTCDRNGLTVALTIQLGGPATAGVDRAAPEAVPVIHRALVTSLADFDAGVCIAQDTP